MQGGVTHAKLALTLLAAQELNREGNFVPVESVQKIRKLAHFRQAARGLRHAPLAAQPVRSFNLNISITDETNTKDEKAAYIAAIYAAMDGLLEGVHEKSYVLITSANAAGYGYGGITQEELYIFDKPASIARRLRATG